MCFCTTRSSSFIIINPLTASVAGAPQMILQPASSIFPCSPLPSGTCRTPGLFIPWCCLPSFFLCLPCLLHPFTVPCKMVLARPDEREIRPYHCSLCLFTMIRRGSCCRPDRCDKGSTSVISLNWETYSYHSKLIPTLSMLLLSVILESISGLEPSSVITQPRYLKLMTVSRFCPFTFGLCVDATGVVCCQLGFLSTLCRGLWRFCRDTQLIAQLAIRW